MKYIVDGLYESGQITSDVVVAESASDAAHKVSRIRKQNGEDTGDPWRQDRVVSVTDEIARLAALHAQPDYRIENDWHELSKDLVPFPEE